MLIAYTITNLEMKVILISVMKQLWELKLY